MRSNGSLLLRRRRETDPRGAFLLAIAAIYHTTLDLTSCVNGLVAEGWLIDREDLATISPYLTSKLRRFGDWKLDLMPPPAAVLGRLNLPDPPER